MEHINSWKNKDVFLKQLQLNISQISSRDNYPLHWISFIEIMKKLNCKKFLDIGCGAGIYYKLIKDNFKDIDYFGIDYSEDAINIAKEYWKYDGFEVRDMWNIDENYIKDYDLVHMGALLDVLPNANEALDFILKLKPKILFLSRIEYSGTIVDSVYTYTAYDEITTYKFKHSQEILKEFISRNNYEFEEYQFTNNSYNIICKRA